MIGVRRVGSSVWLEVLPSILGDVVGGLAGLSYVWIRKVAWGTVISDGRNLGDAG